MAFVRGSTVEHSGMMSVTLTNKIRFPLKFCEPRGEANILNNTTPGRECSLRL